MKNSFDKKKIFLYISMTLFLICFLLGTYYFFTEWYMTGNSIQENMFYLMVWIGGGYGTLRLGGII